MNEFVERCRQEWIRLGVDAALVDEMAAELAADLHDAQEAGMSLADYLGPSATDPQRLAAAWAAERGVVPPPTEPRPRGRRHPVVLVGFTVAAALALMVAALLLITGQPSVSVVTSRTRQGLSGPLTSTTSHALPGVNASAPIEWMFLVGSAVALAFAAWLWRNWGRGQTPNRPA
jgi:hypothetical protein